MYFCQHMFSKEEKKAFQQSFWNGFQKYAAPKRRKEGLPRQWILQNTGIKSIDLKFDFTEDKASVGIDIVSKNKEARQQHWDTMLGLKTLLHEAMGQPMIWDKHYILDSGKEISRIAVYNKEVGIYRPDTHESVYVFFYENMMKLEIWFREYKEIMS